MLEIARRPALYIGALVRRHGLADAVVRLAERLRIPVVTDVLGKASFPESHPQFAGIYMGALGDPTVRALLDESDCVLGIGVMLTDLGTGFWTQRIDQESSRVGDRPGPRLRRSACIATTDFPSPRSSRRCWTVSLTVSVPHHASTAVSRVNTRSSLRPLRSSRKRMPQRPPTR